MPQDALQHAIPAEGWLEKTDWEFWVNFSYSCFVLLQKKL